MQSDQINELAKALSKAQAKIKGAEKDGTNPHFRSHYSTLASVREACQEALSSEGIAITQTTTLVDGEIILVTTLMHESGQWINGSFPIRSTKQDMQAIGSALTYARRYSLAAMVGVAALDDDAESTMVRDQSQQVESIPIPASPANGVWKQVELANKTFPDSHKKFPSKQFKEVITGQDGISFAMWAQKQIESGNNELPKYVKDFFEYAKPFISKEFGPTI